MGISFIYGEVETLQGLSTFPVSHTTEGQSQVLNPRLIPESVHL